VTERKREDRGPKPPEGKNRTGRLRKTRRASYQGPQNEENNKGKQGRILSGGTDAEGKTKEGRERGVNPIGTGNKLIQEKGWLLCKIGVKSQ